MTTTHSSAVPASRRWIEEEFERFAAGLRGTTIHESVPQDGQSGGCHGVPRSVTAQFIYEYALEFVASEGIDALTLRRLAAGLKISTRTLYKRIGNRANMIRELINLHLARLNLVVELADTWEETTWAWCVRLHRALTAQPHLTYMSQAQTLPAIRPYVNALIEATVREGIPHSVAAECCWSLAALTINDAAGTAHAALNDGTSPQAAFSSVELSKTTADAIKWIVLGVRTAASPTPAGRDAQ